MSKINLSIGIDTENCKILAEKLSILLADTYLLYIKTQNFHWNVTGPNFYSLHKMFEEQYLELAEAVDLIAERIRAYNFLAPGSYKEFSKLSKITEADKPPYSEQEMLKLLLETHQILIRDLQEVFPVAEKINDQATMDLIIERLRAHEKTAWMLQSSLVK